MRQSGLKILLLTLVVLPLPRGTDVAFGADTWAISTIEALIELDSPLNRLPGVMSPVAVETPSNDALDRCWAVKMGMSAEEVSRLLGAHVFEGGGTPQAKGKYFPCFFRIKAFGVYEIQINEHRSDPPHEAMFAEALKRGIATWGLPGSIEFSEDKFVWYADWGHRNNNNVMLKIEQEPAHLLLTGGKNGSLIDYILLRWPSKK